RRFEQRPLEPRRIAQMAALDSSAGPDAQPDENIAAESFHQRSTFARTVLPRGVRAQCAGRQSPQCLANYRDALFDFADANPYAGIHIAFLQCRHLEGQLIIGWISDRFPRVEGAPGGAADES